MQDTDRIYGFATKIKIPAYLITHSGFHCSTLTFRGEVLNYLYMLLSFISSIHSPLTSDGRNFNHIKM